MSIAYVSATIDAGIDDVWSVLHDAQAPRRERGMSCPAA